MSNITDATGPTSSTDYWQRKGHALHFRTQAGQPYGSMSRKCDRCGVMIWPERVGNDKTPLWTDDENEYNASKYRCDNLTAERPSNDLTL